jgi:hypothetical protein
MIEAIPDMPPKTIGMRVWVEADGGRDRRRVAAAQHAGVRWMTPGEARLFALNELHWAKEWVAG